MLSLHVTWEGHGHYVIGTVASSCYLTVPIFVVLGDGRGGVLALTLELGRDGLRGVPLLFLFWPPLMSILSSNLLYIVFESL